jgi:hypothetical protein
MDGRECELLERLVLAQERHVQLIENELENQTQEGAPPSECPNCGKMNPVVTQLRLGAGPVDEFVLVGETHCCNKAVFAVPVQMVIAPNIEAAKEIQEIKKGGMKNGTA